MSDEILDAWKAAQFNWLPELQSLVPSKVKATATLRTQDNPINSLLMSACAHGSLQCAEYLLANEADPNQRNFAGYTALHWAAYTGRTECVKLLVENNAEVDCRTNDGRTPLHIAALRGHKKFIELLLSLETPADEAAVASNGWTAVHFAVISNQKDVAEYLLKEKSVDVSAPDASHQSILDLGDRFRREWLKALLE